MREENKAAAWPWLRCQPLTISRGVLAVNLRLAPSPSQGLGGLPFPRIVCVSCAEGCPTLPGAHVKIDGLVVRLRLFPVPSWVSRHAHIQDWVFALDQLEPFPPPALVHRPFFFTAFLTQPHPCREMYFFFFFLESTRRARQGLSKFKRPRTGSACCR